MQEHLAADVAHVRGAGAQVLLVERVERGGRVVDGGRPGAGGGRRRVPGDPGLGVADQLRVVEQREVRVEDRGRGRPGVVPHAVAGACDVGPRRGQGGREALPLLRGTARHHRVEVRRGRPRLPGGPDADARRGRHRPGGTGRLRRRGWGRLPDVVERPPGERDQRVDGGSRTRAGGPDLDVVAAPHPERGHPGQARRRHPAGSGRGVAQPDVGAGGAHQAGEPRGRPRVEPVRGADREPGGDLTGPGAGRGRRPGPLGSRGAAEVPGLRGQPGGGLARHLVAARPARRGHRRRHQPLDQRCGGEHDPLAHVVGQELQGELGREHRAAEVHEHDDAVAVVRLADRLGDRGRVGAEQRAVDAGGNGDPEVRALDHLPGEGDRRGGERARVRDDDEAGHARQPAARPAPPGCPEPSSAPAAAATSRVADVAPGSWCPTLRSPR